jgi:hypothetical protein
MSWELDTKISPFLYVFFVIEGAFGEMPHRLKIAAALSFRSSLLLH